jgi:hypothetical protein
LRWCNSYASETKVVLTKMMFEIPCSLCVRTRYAQCVHTGLFMCIIICIICENTCCHCVRTWYAQYACALLLKSYYSIHNEIPCSLCVRTRHAHCVCTPLLQVHYILYMSWKYLLSLCAYLVRTVCVYSCCSKVIIIFIMKYLALFVCVPGTHTVCVLHCSKHTIFSIFPANRLLPLCAYLVRTMCAHWVAYVY